MTKKQATRFYRMNRATIQARKDLLAVFWEVWCKHRRTKWNQEDRQAQLFCGHDAHKNGACLPEHCPLR